ncbi:NAD(P)H-hydrate dehydratase [Altererythrobacter sp. CAU 1778]
MDAELVLTAVQMRAAEQQLIDAGSSVDALMERAGRGAAEWVWRMAGGRPVTVLCGPSNNGGDGYVIARVLAERGLPVDVVAPMPPATDAAIAACKAWGGKASVDPANGILVDCLFGTGLSRPIPDDLEDRLRVLRLSHECRIAVDLPSGVFSDDGSLANGAIPPYDLTLALGAWKPAHWTMPASAIMGERRLIDLGIPFVEGAAQLANRPKLAAPSRDSYKYTRGLVAIVAGEMPGAAALASRAALHAGAGYVKAVGSTSSSELPPEIVKDADGLSDDRVRAALIGPGLGRSEESAAKLRAVLAIGKPTVIDADALILLDPAFLRDRRAPVLLTPHEGELRQLCETFGVDASGKAGRASALAAATNGHILAKGSDTILATPDGQLTYFPPASPWLSTAGSGDVLAGIIASRLATGVTPSRAAIEGYFLNREAAHLAGSAFGASGLVDCLPEAYARLL